MASDIKDFVKAFNKRLEQNRKEVVLPDSGLTVDVVVDENLQMALLLDDANNPVIDAFINIVEKQATQQEITAETQALIEQYSDMVDLRQTKEILEMTVTPKDCLKYLSKEDLQYLMMVVMGKEEAAEELALGARFHNEEEDTTATKPVSRRNVGNTSKKS